ncbi:helix-turn-helix domain containing protein [Nocardioides sp. CER19]|uniref:TetR/AcrR family transcriptional regulator n=1 Tax=Nocardioides sp. CER19 TaxID=3038538 RepID=UPI00244B7526|nr:helix-turn-helix domain containing protein [Nocardioides sp. CER19]MDH2412880.1 helix-turn-helix domain containing protein [Nocardioides sp. CER19]
MTATRPSARDRLLQAADRLFYAEGVHTVGIDRIIEEAGVAKGSLFYNFAGKDDLVASYLAGRDERRRARIARHTEGLTDPVDKLLAVFDALQEAVGEPGYNGCAFANASAEAAPGSVEAVALRTYRGWFGDLLLRLATEAAYDDPSGVADRLRVIYDGAASGARLDAQPAAVAVAKELARLVLETAPRSAA